MAALIRTNFTGLFSKNASYLHKSHRSFFVSLHFSSASRKKQLVSNRIVSDFLLHKYQFSPKVATKVGSALTHVQDTKNADSILLFLRESGFSNTQLEKIVRYLPRILSASLDATIKPKIKTFQELGFSSSEIAEIISNNPLIFHVNPNTRVIPALSVLKGLLGSNYDMAKLLGKSGWLLTNDLEKTLLPNIEILKSCGIPTEQIVKFLFYYSRFLLLKPENIRKSIEKAEEMGADRGSNLFIYAIRVASMNTETLDLKLQTFRNVGFSEDDIKAMFRKAPQVFTVSTEKIKKTKEFLLGTGKYKLSCIANNPASLACSTEKRYKPRMQVLGILESRNLLRRWPSLGTIYSMKNEEFLERFVCPYLDEVDEFHTLRSSLRGKGAKKIDLLKELG